MFLISYIYPQDYQSHLSLYSLGIHNRFYTSDFNSEGKILVKETYDNASVLKET